MAEKTTQRCQQRRLLVVRDDQRLVSRVHRRELRLELRDLGGLGLQLLCCAPLNVNER